MAVQYPDLTPALFEKADSLFAADDIFGALMAYHTSLSDSSSVGDQVYALARIARSHLKFNQPEIGQPFLEHAKMLAADNLLSSGVMATLAATSGRYAWEFDMIAEAAEAFEQQVVLAHKAGDQRLEIEGLNRLAIAQMEQHHNDEAADTLARAHMLAEAYTIEEQLGPVFNNRAQALRALGNHQDALEAFGRSAQAYEAEGDVHMELVARYEIGVSLLDLGRYDESKACMEEVFTRADSAGLRGLLENVWQIVDPLPDVAA